MKTSQQICLFIAVCCLCYAKAGREAVSLKGRLMCGESPASGVKVKLVDKDIGLDDKIGETKTDRNGYFSLQGHAFDFFHIDPVLKIYHRCNHFGLCQRRWQFKIPRKYVQPGRKSKKVLDIGTWNLILVPRKEDWNCI